MQHQDAQLKDQGVRKRTELLALLLIFTRGAGLAIELDANLIQQVGQAAARRHVLRHHAAVGIVH